MRAANKPIRVVMDTNVFVSAVISKTGLPARLLLAAHKSKIKLLTSDAIVDEYLRVLSYPKIRKYKHITDESILDLAAFLMNKTERIEVTSVLTLSPDPDDNKFLEASIDGGADALVTGDKVDLLQLKAIDEIPILTAFQFLEMFEMSLP